MAILWARQGATVVDFAYHVHTDVGNQMVGVKVRPWDTCALHFPCTHGAVCATPCTAREPDCCWCSVERVCHLLYR